MRYRLQVCFSACVALGVLCGFTIEGQVLAQECPVDGAVIRGAFDLSDQTMPGHLERNGQASTCAEQKEFPGVYDPNSTNLFETFEFRNFEAEACVTATLDVGTCDAQVHLMAYLDSFDPNDLRTNYLADVGTSVSQPFSFVVPKGQRFVVVAQTNYGATTCSYSFTLSGANCAQPAPALSGLGLAGGVALLLLVGLHAFMRRSRTLV